jgi:hypothetical protein
MSRIGSTSRPRDYGGAASTDDARDRTFYSATWNTG